MNLFKAALPLVALALVAGASASAHPQAGMMDSAAIERLCAPGGDQNPRVQAMQQRAERMADKLNLNDTQKAAFKDLQDTQAKLRADRRTELCANKPDLSNYKARLAFRQTVMEKRLEDMKVIQPKLIAFYDSLDAGQKAKFDAMQKHMGKHRHKPMMPKGQSGEGK